MLENLIAGVILFGGLVFLVVFVFRTHKLNRAADEKRTKWRTEFIERNKKFDEEQYALPRIDNKVSEVVPCRKCRSTEYRASFADTRWDPNYREVGPYPSVNRCSYQCPDGEHLHIRCAGCGALQSANCDDHKETKETKGTIVDYTRVIELE